MRNTEFRPNPLVVAGFLRFSKFSALIAATIGCIVITGWIFNLPELKSIRPGWIAMRINTAAALVLTGISICFLQPTWQKQFARTHQPIGILSAILVALLGGLNLVQFIFQIDLGIDQLLISQSPQDTGMGSLPPGRMAPNTAFNFTLIGIILPFLHLAKERTYIWSQFISLAVLLVTLPAFIGYCYAASFLEGLAYSTQMAFHTSLSFVLISVSLICVRPDHGFFSLLSSESEGGTASRRTIPMIIGIPFAIGWIVLKGYQAGHYGVEFGIALSVIGNIFFLGVAVWWNSRSLDHLGTERKKAEQEKALLAVREASAVEASRMKSQFLANMSHEIRTPMHAIMGIADILIESKLTEEQEKFVRIFRRATNTLLGLINDILDLSKIEAGELTIDLTEFNLLDTLESVAEMMALRAHEKKLDLILDVDPELPTVLRGDPNRVRQILVNLIGNAIKFTQRGEITLRVQAHSANPQNHKQMILRFSITDTGIGIAEDKLEKIFETFVQADSSIASTYGGTGLGLSISKRLVEIMGGTIWAKSIEGAGSTFYFTLPLELGDSPFKPNTSETISELRNARVLIVDDSQTNRLILKKFLERFDARVSEADGAEEALELVRSAASSNDHFKLILSDFQMPGTNGIQLAEKLKKMTPAECPIFMMLTSDGVLASADKMRTAGINVSLLKPIKRAELLSSIKRALTKGPAPFSREMESQTTPSISKPIAILVVEDHEDNRVLIQTFLKSTLCKLEMAENGKVAIEKFKRGKFDLILMDMNMPVMDGYQATKEIRTFERDRALSETPIVALTAYALKEEAEKCLSAGCTTHITKPVSKNELIRVISKLTETPQDKAA